MGEAALLPLLMSDLERTLLRTRAREKIASLELPSPDNEVGRGQGGSGHSCSLCNDEIPKHLVEKPSAEYVVQWRKSERVELLRFHTDCFQAWIAATSKLP